MTQALSFESNLNAYIFSTNTIILTRNVAGSFTILSNLSARPRQPFLAVSVHVRSPLTD